MGCHGLRAAIGVASEGSSQPISVICPSRDIEEVILALHQGLVKVQKRGSLQYHGHLAQAFAADAFTCADGSMPTPGFPQPTCPSASNLIYGLSLLKIGSEP
jgi:hypothetical protein